MEWDFEKNAMVESLDSIPSKYQGLYTEVAEGEDAGKFTISESVKGLVTDYIGVGKSLHQARGDKKTASDEAASRRNALKAFEDLATDLGIEVEEGSELHDAMKAHVSSLMEQAQNGKDVQINIDKIKAEHARRADEAISKKSEETQAMQKSLFSHLVIGEARSALADAKGNPDLLLPIVEKRCQVVQDGDTYKVRVVDDQGDARSDGAGGWMGVQELVAEMKSSDSFAQAFESESNSGGGKIPESSPSNQRPSNDTGDKNSVTKIADGLRQFGDRSVGAGA
jgi:hypothetical protein